MESKYTNKYDNAYSILEKLEQGGSGGGGGDVALVDGTKFKRSTFSTIPEYYDFSEITNFEEMFANCDNLTNVGNLDLSNGTNFSYTFYQCPNITTVGNLDMSSGTDFIYMFTACSNITSVGNFDMSNGTNYYRMFWGCSNLKSVGKLETSNGTNFREMFDACTSLQTIESINLSNGNGMEITLFKDCAYLENITLEGSLNGYMNFVYCPLLTYDSIKSILTACAATINTDTKKIRFNSTMADPNGELEALIGECTTKGWTILDLVLE